MIVLVVAVLAVWVAATTVLVGRRNPIPTVAAQAPIGPMTPTFRTSPAATVTALPVPWAVTTTAA